MDAPPAAITTFHLNPDEATYVESCLARRRELMALSRGAPDGHVLARCEDAAVEAARQYGHRLLTAALAERLVVAEEKKSGRPGPVRAANGGTAAARTTARF
jgi:hypothetical protein